MAEGKLTMSRKERQRMLVMEGVKRGRLSLKEAAGQLRLSYRQAKRVWKRFRKWGAEGLTHQARGRVSNRRLAEDFKAKVLAVYSARYKGFGPTKAAEELRNRERLNVDHETLRRWLLAANAWESGRERRKHRKRRERRAHRGELIQLDGSSHKWYGDRALASCLMVMVDDATGASLTHMAASETIEAAFVVLEKWIRAWGVPKALYVDGKYVPREGMSKKELAERTDFARACKKLGIEIIQAHSAQAKGRVERKNQLYQDRLVKDLFLEGISDIAATNRFLPKMDRHLNKCFAKPPADPEDWHRPLAPGENLRDILCFEETRTLANDWTIRYHNRFFQIEHQDPLPAPGSRITVRRRRDGVMVLLHKEHTLRFKEISARPLPPPKAAMQPRPHKPYCPAPDHPWRNSQPAAPRSPAAPPPPRLHSPLSLPLSDRDALRPPKPSPKKKGRALSSAPASSPRPGAQVALQRCPILRTGNNILPPLCSKTPPEKGDISKE